MVFGRSGRQAGQRMAFLSSALMMALPANAQLAPAGVIRSAEPSADADDIVVTGKTDAKPAEVRKQARAITPTGAIYREALAQFQDKVCPGIIGLPADLAEVMVDRIRRNAERIGLRAAPEGKCQPNIIAAFVLNGQKALQDLTKRQPQAFRRIPASEVSEMLRDKGPVHAWTNTEVRSRQGDTLQGDNSDDMTQIPVLNVAQSQSHIFLAARLDISNSIVLIDFPAIDGMSVVQLADYVTMRTFARTLPVEGDAAASTILSLFDKDAAPPRELTDFDVAYLRSIYGSIASLNGASKLAHINRELRKAQAEGATDEEDPAAE